MAAGLEGRLEALQPTRLAETEKLSALLLVNVYVRGQTQLATGLARGVRPGDNPGTQYARMLLRLADPERFPRLTAAMTQHAAAPGRLRRRSVPVRAQHRPRRDRLPRMTPGWHRRAVLACAD